MAFDLNWVIREDKNKTLSHVQGNAIQIVMIYLLSRIALVKFVVT